MVSISTRFLTAIGVCIILWANTASADENIYRYRDDNGVWHFTNINSDRRYKLYKKYRDNPMLFIHDYGSLINQASEKFGVETSLIKAVIRAESSFNPKATSSDGSQGLMQLMPGTADDLEVDDAYDPEENIFGGTKYLSILLGRFKNNIRLALAAYNAGPESVDKYNGVPPFQETKTYIKRVLEYYNKYKTEAD